MTKPTRRRCAIYTRKSSEEGLEQDFNSLHAQREACTAYVASQAGEGWELLSTAYDDGGFSGGSMERPGLRELLADIDRGRIDIVVVYKVDRLTRSLADFARIVERFEAKGASFVSVTQAFNTTTSMGRLTLNVLLSFAQFEREVTGERIRDKIAASKAKGLWMGGNPMLGYNPKGRTLEVDPDEAKTVRYIFERYLELGSVHQLRADLAARGLRAKTWITNKGTTVGGGILARGALYHLLRNRHYLGEIVHKSVSHQGLHTAIIEADLFAAVQSKLDQAAQTKRDQPIRAGGSPLTGLVFDDAGHAMSPSHARGKARQPHRYYVSKAILTGEKQNAGSLGRIPAKAIEDLIADRLQRIMAPEAFAWESARALIKRVTVSADSVTLTLVAEQRDPSALLERLPHGDTCTSQENIPAVIVPTRLGRRGGAMRLLDPTGRRVVDRPEPDPALIRALAKGWRWRELLLRGAYATSAALAADEGLTSTSVSRLVRLTYLAPDLIREILDGRQRPGLTLDQLCRAELPLDWTAQRRLFSARPAP
jgi:DNA invertase Pin-like site-specific DNA recombinase